jgi:hypothetical protein
MEKNKTHYRNVAKSDHLGVADLEDMIEKEMDLIFTIRNVKQEIGASVAGKKGNFNIAYFVEKIKPLVLNKTNAKILKVFSKGSPFVEDWNNLQIELYIDENVKMKGDIVGGVRISPKQPKAIQQVKPQFTEANFEKAKEANATIAVIKIRYSITSEMETKFNNYVTA